MIKFDKICFFLPYGALLFSYLLNLLSDGSQIKITMSKVAELVKVIFDKSRTSNTFARCLKNVELITAADGKCKAELKVDQEHLNFGGTLHGGFTSTLVDCISTYALMSHKIGIPGVSVDLHVTFLNAAFLGDVISIDARTIKAGKTLAFLEVELSNKDNGAVIARGVHTKFIGVK